MGHACSCHAELHHWTAVATLQGIELNDSPLLPLPYTSGLYLEKLVVRLSAGQAQASSAEFKIKSLPDGVLVPYRNEKTSHCWLYGFAHHEITTDPITVQASQSNTSTVGLDAFLKCKDQNGKELHSLFVFATPISLLKKTSLPQKTFHHDFQFHYTTALMCYDKNQNALPIGRVSLQLILSTGEISNMENRLKQELGPLMDLESLKQMHVLNKSDEFRISIDMTLFTGIFTFETAPDKTYTRDREELMSLFSEGGNSIGCRVTAFVGEKKLSGFSSFPRHAFWTTRRYRPESSDDTENIDENELELSNASRHKSFVLLWNSAIPTISLEKFNIEQNNRSLPVRIVLEIGILPDGVSWGQMEVLGLVATASVKLRENFQDEGNFSTVADHALMRCPKTNKKMGYLNYCVDFAYSKVLQKGQERRTAKENGMLRDSLFVQEDGQQLYNQPHIYEADIQVWSLKDSFVGSITESLTQIGDIHWGERAFIKAEGKKAVAVFTMGENVILSKTYQISSLALTDVFRFVFRLPISADSILLAQLISLDPEIDDMSLDVSISVYLFDSHDWSDDCLLFRWSISSTSRLQYWKTCLTNETTNVATEKTVLGFGLSVRSSCKSYSDIEIMHANAETRVHKLQLEDLKRLAQSF